MMVRSPSRALLLPLCAGYLAACDSPNEPTPNGIRDLSANAHEVVTGCTDGATKLEVSVYPKSIDPGKSATPYASVYDAAGTAISSRSVRWSIQDTTIVHVTGIDSDGRPILTGVRGGTTQIIGTCGSLVTPKPLTVNGAVAPAGSVAVTFPVQSLSVGQSVQAMAHAFDASGQSVAIGTITWSTSDNAIASVSTSGLVTGKATGTVTITAAAAVATGSASIPVGQTSTTAPPPTTTNTSGLTATDPAAPQSTPTYAGLPGATREIRVASGGDLQGALDRAQPGDAILLAAGARFTGNFVLRDKGVGSSCSAWITIRTDGATPGIGQRVTPSSAAGYAKLVTPNVAPALRTDPKASCYRVSALELALPVLSVYNYGLVALGDGGWAGAGETQVTTDIAPTKLVLDHLYIHGASGSNFTRCVALNSANTVIADSWIADCHAIGFDSQAIAGWNGPGPYLIENNYLEAAGENIMFGGADPGIPNLVPSDITIRRNHFYKNPSWRGVWTVKNLLELKNARRLLVEGNVFENNWADAQTGMAIVIKSANDGGKGPWQGTTDLNFRYNIVRNSPQGLNVAAHPESNPVNPVARVRVEQNFFENIGQFNGSTNGRMLILLQDLHDVTVAHNTMIHNFTDAGQMMISDYSGGNARNIVLRDNVATKGGPYGAVMYSGVRIGTASLDAFALGSWAFDRNVVIGLDAEFVPWHPQASFYAPTIASVGFTNPSGSDYSLSASSPYRGKATDGTDPGVDFNTLRQKTNNVVIR